MTIKSLRRIAAPSVAPFLLALSLAAGCGTGTDSVPASFDRNAPSPYGSAWTVTGLCGNGTLDVGEACDDGNGLSGDGCSASCTIETDYTCTNTAPVSLVNAGFNAQGASLSGATGTQITGWTVTAGNVDLLVPVEPQASWLLTAEGTGMIDLAGSANGVVGQSFPTAGGRGYTVHFAHAARCPSTAPCTRTFQVDLVDGGGTVLTTAKFTGAGDPQPAWQIGTVFFKALGTSTTVRFTGTDLTDTTNGALIDAVSIPATTCYLVPQLSCMTPQSALGDLSLNGVATVNATSIVATPSLGTQLGAVFSTRTFAPSSFTAVARLRIGSPSATPGDGFALVFQNDPRGPAAIGCPGEGLGYGQQPGCTTPVISPSVAVEIDTYYNATWDAGYPNPHIAIDANGNVLHASPAVMPSFPMVSATFTVWADYNLATRVMQVFGSAGTVKPATPILVFTLTPAQAAVFDNPFYAGITGSTGGSYESQEILYYSISTTGIVDANGDGLDDRCNTCGNGYVDAVGEECDDGNLVNGDGCSSTCKREPGEVCTGVPSVCSSRCGDGIVSGSEACDDGNTVSSDGCSSTCQPEAGFVCSAPSATNTLITVDATAQCAATGSASTFLPTTLPAGRYGLFYESGAAQITATPTYQVAIEARASTNGTTWTNTPIVSTSAATSALAIGNAVGNRGFFNTNGSTTWFFFPDASCGNNSGTDAFRLRGVSLCQQIPDTTLTVKPGALSNSTGPSFTFTATVGGSTFECSLDGAGFTACTTPKTYVALAEGPHTFSVRAVNGAAVDPTPASWSWTIDSVALPPVIGFPGAGSQVPGSPTVTGTAEAGGSVTVREGATTLCTVTVDSTGNWTCPTTLLDGSHTLAATQTDLATNTSAAANVTFNVATTLPPVALAAPAVIWSGNAAAYPVSGTCGTADGTVTVTVGTATGNPFLGITCDGVGPIGTFSIFLNTAGQADAASLTITASQTNVLGTGTASRLTRKDTVALAPTIAAPADGSLVAANPSVSGAAEPGASVTVKNGAATLCSVVADGAGGWSCATTLTEAAYTLSATQVDVAGNTSAAATVDFTVVTAPVVAITSGTTIFSGNATAYPVTGACKTLAGPVSVTVGTATGSATCTGSAFTATLDVHLLADGPSVTVTATQSNPAGTGSASRSVVKDTVALPPAIASPAEGSEAAVNPTLSGNTEDFATVTVKEGATTLCAVTASSSGNWSCATTLGVGSHALTSTMVDAAGNASGAATRNFTVVGPPVVTVNAPAQIVGSNVAAYPIAGTCTTAAGAVSISVGTRTPTTTTCTGGTFSGTFNATTEPDAPSVPVIASQTNGSGTGRDSKSTLKDATAAAPAIAFPTAGSTVPNAPTFTGTAEAGATLVVTDPGLPVATCTTTVDAGGNWSCTFGALPTGTRTFSAVQTDLYGNTSGATTRSVTVSAVAVTIDTLLPITAANAANYSVTGTCTGGTGTVTVRVGTGGLNRSQTGLTCTAGTYTTTSPFDVSGIADAASVQVRATYSAIQVSEYTRKDTTAAAPVITAPANNGTTPATTTITGTSEVGASVTVTEGSALCTVTATSAGTWSCTLTLSLGVHAITARQTDIDGNVSGASGVTNFTVVPVPSVTLAAPAVIAAANATAFPVSGTCVTGAGNVTVTIGAVSATPACTAAAFSATLDVSAVADASSVLVGATQANVAGSSTDTKTTRKDTVAAVPAITTPGASAEVPPSPAITGSGEPGATVTVKEGAPTVCTTIVDGAGSWSCTTTLALGAHSVTATQVDTAGNISAASVARSFTCAAPPTVALAAPSVINGANAVTYGVSGSCTTAAGDVTLAVGTIPGSASCAAGAFSASLDVTSLADAASVTVTASQTNGVGTGTDSKSALKDTAANPPAFTAPAPSAEVAANPAISGTSENGASVTVRNGAATVCSATADGSGNWTCSSTLGIGSYSVTATQTDTAGNTSAASVERAFTVLAPPTVTLTAPGVIFSGNAAAYPVAGTCTGTYTVDLTVGAAFGTAACAAGAFSTTLNVTAVADAASVTVSGSQTNVAGTGTDSKTALKDTVANAPAFTAPAASAEVAANPTISGTSENGASVTVRNGAATVCSATADGAGNWTCSSTLGVGGYSVTATQTDTAGNTSAASAAHAFTVVAPPTIALDAPGVIRASNVLAFPVTGTCTTGYTVNLTVGSVGATAACAAATFATTVDVSSLADAASVTVTAGQTNVSGTGSDSKSTRKDTVAAPPAISTPASGAEVVANPGLTGTAEADATVTVLEGGLTVCTATANGAGAWSCATTLGVGTHTLTATQVDTAGNTSAPSADHLFSVVAAPVVALAAPGVIFSGNAAAYTVSGTCSGTYTVGITVGAANGSAACAAGAFNTTVDVTAIPDAASVTVTAGQTNVAGTGTDSRSTLKDTVANPPAISAPAVAAEVAANPAISGSSENGASVTVRNGAATVCSATADGSGNWTCSSTLGIGSYSVTATQTDPAGNTSAASVERAFTVLAPPIVTLNAPGVIYSGNAAAYAVAGSCTGTYTVDLTVGAAFGTAPCAAGAFSTTLDVTAVPDAASVTVSASQTNVGGTGTDSKTTLKDTVASPPVFTAPASGAEVGPFFTVSGTAEASGSVTVAAGATPLCTATANGAGAWSCATTVGLATGARTILATQTDTAGNVSTAASLGVNVVGPAVVVLAAPATISSANAAAYPVAGTCTNGASATTVTVTVGAASTTAACTAAAFATTLDVSAVPDGLAVLVIATQSTAGGAGADSATAVKDTVAAAPVVLFPGPGDLVAPNPTLSGTAEPFASVAVTESAAPICTGAADASGNWSCASTLAVGPHTLDAVQTDVAGNGSAPTTRAFSVAALPAVTLDTLDVINGANVAAYPVHGTCTTADGNVTVAVGTVLKTVACGVGAYATTLDVTVLAEGPSVTVTASQTNVSGTGTALKSTAKDTVANPPAVSSPAADAQVAPNPGIAGTAEPFANVTVNEGATTVCSATADAAGSWNCATTLGLGAHTVAATQTDPAGNISAATTRAFTVVGVPVVTLNPLPPINVANRAAWAVIGACDPAAGSVTVTVGIVVATVPCSGTFSANLDLSALGDGPAIAVSALQTNATGTGTDTRTVQKDTVALAPSILSPADGGTVAPNPAISGNAEPGSAIAVTEGPTPICSAITDGLGAWSCATTASPGPHTLSAVMTDTVGNVGPASSVTFTVADVPVVSLAAPAVIFSGNVTAYPVTGSCDSAVGTVTVSVGAASDTTACTLGAFFRTLDVSALADSPVITVSASQTNVTGTGTASRATLKDTVALPPVFTAPTAGQELVTATPTFTGTAEAGALVVLLVDAVEVGRVTADAVGAWSVTAAAPLALAPHTASATQLDAAGNTSTASTRAFARVGIPVVALDPLAVIYSGNETAFPVTGSCVSGYPVDFTVGGLPGSTACSGGTFATTLNVTAVADAAAVTVTASQSNVAGTGTDSKTTLKDTVANSPAFTSPAPASELAANPTLDGAGEPGATVTVKDGGATVCTATADGSGNWTCAATLGAGSYTLTATQTDAAGNTSTPSAGLSFSVVAPPVVTLAAPAVIASGNAAAFPVAGSCVGSYTVDVAVGGVTGSTACAAGAFATTLNVTAVADGASVTVTASQTNVAGTGSDSKTTLKDTVAAPPAITSPAVGAEVAADPTISGTSENGASVTVRNGATTVCSATADGSGNWTCGSTLGVGIYSVTATQTDTAGNSSAASAARAFTVVATPVVSLAAPAAITSDNAAAYPVAGSCVGTYTVDLTVGTASGTAACTAGAFSTTLNVTAVADAASVTVTASQNNAAGTGTDSKTTSKSTAVAPAAVTLAALPTIYSGNATSYAVGGTCSNGTGATAVTVTVGTVSTTAPCTSGAFAATLDVRAVPDGLAVAISAAQSTAGGPGAAATTVVKDTVAIAPVVLFPGAAEQIAPNPGISGTAEPFANVTVTEGATTLCTGTADASGNWSCASTLALGPHSIDAVQADTAGNVSPATSRAFTVTALPVVSLDALDVIHAANASAYPVGGSCTASAGTVTVAVGAITTTTACTAGTYGASLDVQTLADGASVTVSASQTNASGTSNAVRTTPKDTVANAPVVASPAAGSLVAPNPTITGTAEPFATVHVTETSANVCTAPVTADAAGDWSCATTLGLGAHTIAATQTDPAGNPSAAANRSFTVSTVPVVLLDPLPPIDNANEAAYVVIGSCDATAGSVTVTVAAASATATVPCTGSFSATLDVSGAPDSPSVAVEAAQSNSSGTARDTRNVAKETRVAPTVVTPAALSVIDFDVPVVLAGTAAPNATVTVSIDGTAVGTATANGTGQWTLTLPARTLAPSAHTATAADGSLTSAPHPFTVRLPEVQLTGGGCGCQGGGGSGGGLALLLVLGAALRRRARRVNLSA